MLKEELSVKDANIKAPFMEIKELYHQLATYQMKACGSIIPLTDTASGNATPTASILMDLLPQIRKLKHSDHRVIQAIDKFFCSVHHQLYQESQQSLAKKSIRSLIRQVEQLKFELDERYHVCRIQFDGRSPFATYKIPKTKL